MACVQLDAVGAAAVAAEAVQEKVVGLLMHIAAARKTVTAEVARATPAAGVDADAQEAAEACWNADTAGIVVVGVAAAGAAGAGPGYPQPAGGLQPVDTLLEVAGSRFDE
jgi:hypothetical protein